MSDQPRKVKGMARVKGHTFYRKQLKEMVKSTPRIHMSFFDKVGEGEGYKYEIQCVSEDVSEVLAHFLRKIGF